MIRFLSVLCLLVFAFKLNAQIQVECKKTAVELVQLLVGANANGIKISDVKYTGNPQSIGVYNTFSNAMPIKSGIVLSTGRAADVDGPNEMPNTGTAMFSNGDAQLQENVKNKTSDAAILEFTFIANTNEISFQYSFASEEYPEYVNKGVNDVFAFFISGKGYNAETNIAIVPGSSQVVSVDNINSGLNMQYYIENPKWNISNPIFEKNPKLGEISYNCEFDGMTVALSAKAKVLPYHPYEMKISIADVGDNIYDSGVFLQKQSFKNSGKELPFTSILLDDVNEIIDSIGLVSVRTIEDTVWIVSNIQFAFNSHDIEKEFYPLLDLLGRKFQQYFDMEISIEGHSDDVGNKDYNQNLSEQRAKQVYEYLVRGGVEKARISYTGKGNVQPVAEGGSEQVRRLNRRVEFMVVKP